MTDAHSQPSWPLSWIGRLHRDLVFARRTQVLARALATVIPQNASILDIGCGDGTIGHLIAGSRPDTSVQGVEFLVRPECKIPCRAFDGLTLPFADSSIDVCLFVDVLHHTADARVLLREAGRVCKAAVLVKDHLAESRADHAILGLMDWVGNKPHGVPLPYNYLSHARWLETFSECGLTARSWMTQLDLYPAPLSWLFGRKLHFIALLAK